MSSNIDWNNHETFVKKSSMKIINKHELSSNTKSLLAYVHEKTELRGDKFVAIQNCTPERLRTILDYTCARDGGGFRVDGFYGQMCDWQIESQGLHFCVIGPLEHRGTRISEYKRSIERLEALVAYRLLQMTAEGNGVYKPPHVEISRSISFKYFMQIIDMDDIVDAVHLEALLENNSFLAIMDTGDVVRQIQKQCQLRFTHARGYKLGVAGVGVGIFKFDLAQDDWIVVGYGNNTRPRPDDTNVTVDSLRRSLIDRVYPEQVEQLGIWQVMMTPDVYGTDPPRGPRYNSNQLPVTYDFLHETSNALDESLYKATVIRQFDTTEWLSVVDAESIKDYKTLASLLNRSKYIALLVSGEKYTDSIIFNIENNCGLSKSSEGYEADYDDEHNCFKGTYEIFNVTVVQNEWMVIGHAYDRSGLVHTDKRSIWRTLHKRHVEIASTVL